MGYCMYDLWQEYLSKHGDLDEFLESFKKAAENREQKASYIIQSMLEALGEGDLLKGIEILLSNNFDGYDSIFAIATKGYNDHRILGYLPERMELKMKGDNND